MKASQVFLRLLATAVVLGVLYGGLALFVSRHVPSSTTVDGIAIGGMSPGEANVTLQRLLAKRASSPVHLEGPSRTVDIDPGTAGLEVDLKATLSGLSGLTFNPVTLWGHLAGGKDEPLKVRVDRARLTAAVTEAARAIDSPVKEGSITFTGGTPTALSSAAGHAVVVPATTDAVAGVWPRQQVVKAVMSLTNPKVSADEIARAAREFAVPAMSGPVAVVAGPAALVAGPLASGPVAVVAPPATAILQPAQFATALSLVPDATGTLRPLIDASQLLAAIRAANPAMESTPADATVRLVAGAPQVVPAVVGMSFDAPSAPTAFLAGLTSPARTATMPMITVAPKVTTAMAQSWGVKKEISTFTTAFTYNPPRVNNIKIAVRTLNGTLVRPGEQFSLNKTLGERTPAKGYQPAPVINAGRLVIGYGGGVSQVSTTIFNAAFFSGVRIEQYTSHAFYISRYPEGREATVSWPDVDQKWTNDTGFGILIKASASERDLTVTFLGTRTWDIEAVKGPRRNVVQPRTITDARAGCVPQSPTPGFDVTVKRIFRKSGAGGVPVKTSTFNTHYLPEDRVLCTPAAAG